MLVDNLKQKSATNIKAATLLLSESLYNPSVHCGYYGAFQYMTFAILKKRNISLDILKEESKGASSHIRNIQNFFTLFKDSDRLKAVDIQMNITSAKQFRTKADYSVEDVSEEDAKKHLRIVNKTIDTIKQII